MSESTIICESCSKLGRAESMMRYANLNGKTFAIWHADCAPPKKVAILTRWENVRLTPSVLTPPPNHTSQAELADALERDKNVVETQRLLAESIAKIRQLEADLALIEKGKEAAERALRDEHRASLALARHGSLQINRDWVALANEMSMLKGEPGLHVIDGTLAKMVEPLIDPKEPFFETPAELEAYRATMVIDFMNKYRRGAFSDLERDPEEILVVKAVAYQQSYQVCCEILASKNIKLKIARNVEYKLEREAQSEARVEKERAKQEKRTSEGKSAEPARRKNLTQEEIQLNALEKLCGSREKAIEMKKSLDEAAAKLLAGVKK